MQPCVSRSSASLWPQLTRASDFSVTFVRQAADANLVSKGLGAGSQTLAPEKPGDQEGGGQRVYGAARSHPPAPVASGAVWLDVSVPAVLSSGAHCATRIHPERRRREKKKKKKSEAH